MIAKRTTVTMIYCEHGAPGTGSIRPTSETLTSGGLGIFITPNLSAASL